MSTDARPRPTVADARNNGTFGAWIIRATFRDERTYDDLAGDHIEGPWSLSAGRSYRHGLMEAGDVALLYVGRPTKAAYPSGIYGIGELTGPTTVSVDADNTAQPDADIPGRELPWAHVSIYTLGRPITLDALKAVDTLAASELVNGPQVNPAYLTADELAELLDTFEDHFVDGALAEGAGPEDRGVGSARTDAALNRAIELAATKTVIEYFTNREYTYDDVALRKVGWDVTFAKEGLPTQHVEIKGRLASTPIVALTANELAKARTVPGWILAVVTAALSNDPQLTFYTAEQAIAAALPTHYRANLAATPGATAHTAAHPVHVGVAP